VSLLLNAIIYVIVPHVLVAPFIVIGMTISELKDRRKGRA